MSGPACDSACSDGETELDRQHRLRGRCGHSAAGLNALFPVDAVESSLPIRFEEMVRRAPDALAVIAPHRRLTYRDVGEASNAAAWRLLGLRDLIQQPVAVLSQQGPECCVAMLGALKAGTAVAPLDPVHIDDHLRSILAEVGAAAILCPPQMVDRARAIGRESEIVEIDLAARSPDLPESVHAVRGESPAFIAFTSGSTGRPKGIIRSHRTQLHIARQFAALFGITAADRWSGLHSPGWTSGTSDLATALMSGAALCTWNAHTDGLHGLADWLNHSGVTLVSWTPSAMCGLVAASPADTQLKSVRAVCLGSERLFVQDARRIMSITSPECVFANRLGSSEGGNYRHFFFDRHSPLDGATVPTGYACADRPTRIVNEAGQDCQPGETGEIIVRSDYLASGYWQQPELTQSRFRAVDGLPEFLTGDLGRLAEDGCLEYMGRKDAQVKIRGQRVDPGEVEQVLRQFPGVQDAAVLVRDIATNEPWLAAYYVANGERDATDDIRTTLQQRLPTFLVPRTIVRVPRLPRTAHHKLDQQALIELAPVVEDTIVHRQPSMPLQQLLTAAWLEVLEVPSLGIDDDFFELGGDSLKGMRMLARLSTFLDPPPSVLQLFEAATIRKFAELLQREYPEEIQQLERSSVDVLAEVRETS
jgi:amino acid adenylation domain-containing protein